MSDFNPIADLSYRNYDGPLKPPTFRWWTIAKQTMRAQAKNKLLWAMSLLAGVYYFIMIVALFVIDRIAMGSPQGGMMKEQFIMRLQWREQFLHGLSYAQLPLMIIALIVGSGAIANDNRANALLVYLSKPCTRFDYTFGKWMGVFIVVFAALAVPALGFYGYGILSFRSLGFIKQDPYLLLKLMAVIPLCAALHASLVLAISSLFKQGRIAGAVYSGIYFLGLFFTTAMNVVWQISHSPRRGGGGDSATDGLVSTLFYTSVDGLEIGMAKAILGAKGTNEFGAPTLPGVNPDPPAPALIPCLLIVLVVTLVCLGITWKRVRAVEVVG